MLRFFSMYCIATNKKYDTVYCNFIKFIVVYYLTCRITTLRCPWNGEIVVSKAAMRIGIKESIVDNLTSGGLAVSLNDSG